MIALIPYQRFEIKTKLSQEAAQEKLASIVEPRKVRLGFSRIENPFEGELEGHAFKISRVLGYRNSFIPVLTGEIRDDLDSSTLQIMARPNWAVTLIWPVLLIMLLYSTIFSAEVTSVGMVLLLITFFYGLPTLFFHLELNKAKKLLHGQFETETVFDR